MSVTMAKVEGVTVLTLSADPESACPPLCQIFKGLCYNPVCCSVSQRLKGVQRASQSVLGAMHIMVGLLNIGLAAILLGSFVGSWWQMEESKFPFWFGGMVVLNVIVNLLLGVAFSIAAIVLYSVNIAYMRSWSWPPCVSDDDYYSRYTTISPREEILRNKCMEGKALARMLLKSVNALLIVLSVLELCVAISSAVMAIKALRSSEKRGDKSTEEPEHYKALQEEVTINSMA